MPPVITIQQRSCKALNDNGASVVSVVASQREGSGSLNLSLCLFLTSVNPDGALEQGFNSRSGSGSGSGSTAPIAGSSSGEVPKESQSGCLCDNQGLISK